ncbi:unnamed protein product [Owenia fusiformis]|uniref:Branched-chain-amino-acid aminotransferase n=1 Tax=Owenia fusiformis TaxID=6347 RepID=A0A8J1YDH4_OWEFU|nr:unnamed protein product [Owenia fusiformis]
MAATMFGKNMQVVMSCSKSKMWRHLATSLSKSQLRCMSQATFKFNDLQIEPAKNLKSKPDADKLVFGKTFSDHMLEVYWTEEKGWGAPKICEVHNLDIHPAIKALHYAAELFEGMKAYRGVDDKIRLFRPEENMKRMINSASRAALPTFDGGELTKCIAKLVDMDKDWIPHAPDTSLYMRPTLIGTEPSLGVSKTTEALLFVLIGPVGPYYAHGFQPVSLMADPEYVRAWPGGCGFAKMGSNYGPTIAIQAEAVRRGCQQVLWLYGEDHQLTEVGTMNLFMHWINANGERELVTPPLDGIILPGVTRKSLIEMTKQWGGFNVVERTFGMKEVLQALKENRVKEIFGAGTACVVSPVERIQYMGEDYHIPTMEQKDPIWNRCWKELTDIQLGRNAPHAWAPVVE